MLKIKTADNRVLQDQLQVKISENAEMQQTILLLRQQLESRTADNNLTPQQTKYIYEEKFNNESTPTSVISLNKVFSQEDSIHGSSDTFLNSQLLKLVGFYPFSLVFYITFCFAFLLFSNKLL